MVCCGSGQRQPNPVGRPAARRSKRMSEIEMWIDSIVRRVQELPDRNSPDDQPEMMMVTDKELRDIIMDRCQAINLEIT